MSLWELPPGTFADEGYFDESYPKHVQRAFIVVYYEDIEVAHVHDTEFTHYFTLIEEAITSFAARWGGLSDDAFLRALRGASGPDLLAAIFAIGQSEHEQAADLVAPFLGSANQLERRAAAIVLILRHDERGLLALEEYLLSDPPSDEQGQYRYTPDADGWYSIYRGHIARVVANWGPPSLTPILKKAFLKMWEEEERYGGFWDIWYAQEALLYALGRRGQFSALEGIELPADRKRLAMNFLALGHVRADERFADLHMDMILNKERLQAEVALVLVKHFALSEQEAIESVKLFGSDYIARRTPYGTL